MRPRLADFATTTERRSSEDTAAQWLQQAQHRGTAFTGEAGRGSLERALWWRGDATPLAGYATRGPLGPAHGTLPRRATSSRWRERAKDRSPGSRREPRGARVGERRGWRWARTGRGCFHGDCGIDPRRADLMGAWHGRASPRRVRTGPDQCQGRAGNPAGGGGAGDTGGHRGAIPSINGPRFDSQRFAVDFGPAHPEGRLVVGDLKEVGSWVGYGARVLAAATGRVVAARNDLPDQAPGALPDPQTITVSDVDGNFVVLDHGHGVFTFYAHLQRDSVRVVPGERVEVNQELGRLGNAGNTSAPHLHFHVMAGSSPLGSDGLPFVFGKFDFVGVVEEAALDAALSRAAGLPFRNSLSPAKRERQLPLDRAFIDFEPAARR